MGEKVIRRFSFGKSCWPNQKNFPWIHLHFRCVEEKREECATENVFIEWVAISINCTTHNLKKYTALLALLWRENYRYYYFFGSRLARKITYSNTNLNINLEQCFPNFFRRLRISRKYELKLRKIDSSEIFFVISCMIHYIHM